MFPLEISGGTLSEFKPVTANQVNAVVSMSLARSCGLASITTQH